MTYDILTIGNAIVDVIAPAEEAFLASQALDKGSMRLIDTVEAERLYALMAPGREVSGGSAANTAAGCAALGARVKFIGRVAQDQLGQVFAHDIRAAGVSYDTPFSQDETPTARCLILVTPDGQRTMNTYLGASQELGIADVDYEAVKASQITYLEGYLWDPPAPRAAMNKALQVAHAHGRKIAFTLSDGFCVARHRDDFEMLSHKVDILFANEAEIMALTQSTSFDAALASIRGRLPVAVVTRSEKGAVVLTPEAVHEVPAQAGVHVVDTTGAGDLFAAGFLAGFTQGRDLAACARMGVVAAAEVISHYGARPEADLHSLMKKAAL